MKQRKLGVGSVGLQACSRAASTQQGCKALSRAAKHSVGLQVRSRSASAQQGSGSASTQ